MGDNKKHICIITQSHLCRNPRVTKEARFLSVHYSVTIITNTYSNLLSAEDERLVKDLNIRILSVAKLGNNNLTKFIDKIAKKIADYLMKLFDIQTPLSLGYGIWRFVPAALKLNADAYICHQELGLYCGCKLLKYNKNVAFDFEDWYSEDLLPQARSIRPLRLLKSIEGIALKRGKYCTTTSYAMANKLAKTYSCDAPIVIYNVFEQRRDLEQKNKTFSVPLKLFWFSQTIGPGRGLEKFIKLIAGFKNNMELHLLGKLDPVYHNLLTGLMPEQHQLVIHDLVPEEKLLDKISSFDIGLALELNHLQSRDYTITNKLFQYLQSGLPIIVSKTMGQMEVYEKFKPGFMLSQYPDTRQVKELECWLNNKADLIAARKNALEAASFYNWKTESEKMILNVRNLLMTDEN